MTSDIAIKVENLSKTYKLYTAPVDRLKESLHPFREKYHQDFYALNNVSFEIEKGEAIGIIGKNGSGKSTLLKILTGVLTPSSGTAQVNGKVAALLELGAGFNPMLTGIENVYFNGMLMGYTRAEMDERLDSILSFADIGDFVFQPVKSYSSGMFLRLAFAVAIRVEPEILIIDEALSVGDMFFQAKCMTALDRFREKGCTILFVSHSIQSVKSLCSSAIYLKNGKLSAIGDSAYITDKYLKETREEMNLEHVANNKQNEVQDKMLVNSASGVNYNSNMAFIRNPEFEKINSTFRYGTGEAKIVDVKLLNNDGDTVLVANFNDKVRILIYIECHEECNISVNYNIRDDMNINMLGSNFRIEDADIVHVCPNEKYIVEFETALPVAAGNYNISISVTEPIIVNQSAKFIDVVDNAIVFRVLERPVAKLWSKIYIPNKLNIHKVSALHAYGVSDEK
jgi:ABC-type polysaccharide/polyol phosphate transport system ATPase subunit